MRVQVLVAAMFQESQQLVHKMNLSTNAIIINQCEEYGYEEIKKDDCLIRFFSMGERGVGLSRNNALLRAEDEISLFSDEDIVYIDDYEKRICEEFEKHPEADMITFNFEVNEERKTYENKSFRRVHLYNCGRYPTFSFAIRTDKMHQKNLTYSLLFGGGAKYSNGEDSLFIRDCIKKGFRVYASPVYIGREEGRPSTWFKGYTEKFFYDRGVLYHYLYGKLAEIFMFRFLIKYKNKMCRDISFSEALILMRKGIQDAKM